MIRICKNCKVFLKHRYKIKFCSNKCQNDFQRSVFIDRWKRGLVDGAIGINVRALSGHIRTYLIEKNAEECSNCGWNKRNPITGKVPLEVDHIDGNPENNKETNLRLLCPNCHSLTPFFRNLNKGRGRKWRTDKYMKNS